MTTLQDALAQQGGQAKPVAYITDTHQGPMLWTPEMYNESCTYCDDGEFPVPLYTAAPALQAQEQLSEVQRLDLVTQWFSDEADITRAMQLLTDFEQTTPVANQAPQARPEVDGGEFVNGVWRGVAVPQTAQRGVNGSLPDEWPTEFCTWYQNLPDFKPEQLWPIWNAHALQSAQTKQVLEKFDELQSAQLVAQPLAKTCDTCAHYQQGKHPGVSIHDETCYECRSYWGNKWEAA